MSIRESAAEAYMCVAKLGRPLKCCRSVPLVTDGLRIHDWKI
jgi:hypothetical protein